MMHDHQPTHCPRGFAVEQIGGGFGADGAYFWATHGGAELDLLVMHGGKRYGFECELADAPGTTRSMRVALNDLELDHLWVVYPGHEAYPLDDRISVLPIADMPALARRRILSSPRARCPP